MASVLPPVWANRFRAFIAAVPSAPVGLADQPEYLNAVAAVRCELDAGELLAALLRTEAAHQRRRDQRWGPRTLDLDLLLFGGQRLATAALTVPHPRLHERAFVLVPLVELAPDLRHPATGLPLRRHLEVCDRRPYLRRLGPLRA